jgi:hypothetical protein
VIRKRGGSLQVQVFAGRDPLTGRKRWVSRQVPGHTKESYRQAKKVEAQLLEQVDRGQHRGSRTRTVGELVERWLEWRQQVRPISPVTVANYRGAIDRYILPALGTAKLHEVDAATIDALYARVRAHGEGVCQHAGAALVVVTHWNKTGEGRGARRISGVGPGAWGRVLASAGVAHRASRPDGTSTVVLEVEVTGGEISDQHFRVRRQVRADDPGDLASPLDYAVEVLPDDHDSDHGQDSAAAAELSPSARWVLAALRSGGAMQTAKQLGDRTAADGHPLKERTIQVALNRLAEAGLAAGSSDGNGLPRYWSPADPE